MSCKTRKRKTTKKERFERIIRYLIIKGNKEKQVFLKTNKEFDGEICYYGEKVPMFCIEKQKKGEIILGGAYSLKNTSAKFIKEVYDLLSEKVGNGESF